MTIVVVGGRGFIGGAIVDALRKRGHEVIIVSSHRTSQGGAGVRYGDMLRPETMPQAIAGAEVVVQSANFPTYPFEKRRRGYTFFTFDAFGTRNLVQIAREAGVRRYLFVAGVGASLESPRAYLRAIAEGEKAIQESGLEAVSLRPAFVYGSRDRSINTILRFARLSPFVPLLGNGQQLHQPVFIEDIMSTVIQMVGPETPQGIFEIGGPERMSLREMLTRVMHVARIRRPFLPIPLPLARFGATVLEQLPGSLLTRAGLEFCADSFIACNDALLSTFRVHLTPLEEGLRTYLPTR